MSEERAPEERRWVLRAIIAVTALLHVGLLCYFAPPKVLFSKQPVLTVDYSVHVYQIERARAAFRGWGKLWGYDPQVLAGQPAGVVEDLTSKGTELFVIGLSGLGVHPAVSFNLFIVLVHLLVPFTAYASGRLLRLTRVESAIAALLWVLLWFFDSFLHWCWWIGMISWSATSLLCVLFVALLQRMLETRRVVLGLPLAALAAIITLVHPFSVLAVLVPTLALYARAFRSLDWKLHGMLWFGAACAAATTLVWIGPALRFKHYIGDADTFFRPTAEYLLYDSFDLLKDWTNTGGPVRTALRTLCFVAAGICLWRWHKQRDSRALLFTSFIVSALLVAYGGGYFWYGRQTQPYRQIGPAMLAAALPAAVLLNDVLAPSSLRQLTRNGRVLLALCAVLILPRFVRTVAHYFPDLLPSRIYRSELDEISSSLVGLQGEPKPFAMRHETASAGYREIRQWLMRNHGGRGRIVVAEWSLGEYLAASTRLPILGGLVERNVPHVDAHLFRDKPERFLRGPQLQGYFEQYAVGWVVTFGKHGLLDYRRDLLLPIRVVGGFRIYQTRAEPNYFQRGQGRVEDQSLNSIKLSTQPGSDAVVRFHWMETLRCRPGCSVERFVVPNDRVGFIRVANAPAAFEIYNQY